ncbi:MAG TPA: Calx-beta domain-containing protein, partial [Mycobacteriales bacterium]|nr:Calx-beta domain-containing protein [Mycobacteriales bacterium]
PTNRSTAVLSITDDDQGGAVAFAAASFSVLENAGPATIGVKRTLGTASGVTVHYATTDGTATAGLRYTPTSGTLTFGFGETLKTFTVPVVNDTIGQGPQTVNLTLSSVTGGGTLGGPSTAVLTIQDDDPYISLSAPTYTVSEGAGSLTVTVLRGGDLSRQATLDYATSDQPAGTPHRAIAGVDYTVTTGTLTFAPSVVTRTFTVPILNNSLPQPDRTFVVLVGNAAITGLPPATVSLIAPVAAVVTIKDDDVGGVIQWSAPTYTVREDGGEAILTLTRLGGRAGGVSVRVQTHAAGFVPPGSPAPPAQTATAGANYTSTDLRVTFGPGDTTKTVRIPILNDGTATGNQTVYVEVSDPQPSGATGSPVLGSQTLTTLTIVDAQPSVQFPVATFTATEGSPAATITVQRTAPAGRLTVDFATSSGSATAPTNYLNTAGTLVFPDGVTTQSFTVPLVDNQLVEADKQFNVTLSNLQPPAAATLGPRLTATVTIKEDDRGGTFSVFGGSILEGAKNQNSTFLATVSRTGGSGGAVTVDFRVDDCGHFPGTSVCQFPATRMLDFDPIVTTLTFQAGELSKTVPVIVHGNDIPEGSRNFQLSLTNPSPHGLMQDGKEIGAQIGGGETLVQIVEDDLYFVTLSSETYGAPEGAREFRVPVVRSGTSNFLSNSLTVDMVAVAITALVGQDYVSLGAFDGMSSLAPASAGRCSGLSGRDVVARQNVVFAANETTQTFRVPFLDDTVVDGPKTIVICINDATNTGTPNGPGITFPAAATLTVNDDDNGGAIQFGSDTYVVPDNAGQAIITLTRTGNPNLASGVSVTAQTGDLFAATTPPQTGTAGTDYTSTNATVTFNVGETTASFAVPLLGNGGA